MASMWRNSIGLRKIIMPRHLRVLHPALLHGGLSISFRPVRKAIKRSSAVSNGTFRTYKHPLHPATFLPGRNNGELCFLRFAEMDTSVLSILAQPTFIETTFAGKVVQQIPSFAIDLAGEATIVAVVNHRSYLEKPSSMEMYAAFESAAAAAGWRYYVVTEADLADSPFLKPVSALWRNHRRIYDDLQLRAVINLTSVKSWVIQEAVAHLETVMGSMAPEARHIYSMCAGNKVGIDLQQNGSIHPSLIIRPLAAPYQRSTLIPFRSPSLDLEASK